MYNLSKKWMSLTDGGTFLGQHSVILTWRWCMTWWCIQHHQWLGGYLGVHHHYHNVVQGKGIAGIIGLQALCG